MVSFSETGVRILLCSCSAMDRRDADSTTPADIGYSVPFGLRWAGWGGTTAMGSESGEDVKACI